MSVGRFCSFKDKRGRWAGGSRAAEQGGDDGDGKEDEDGEELVENGGVALGLLALSCLWSTRSSATECMYTYTRSAKLAAKWTCC